MDYVKIPQDPTGGGFQAWPDVARLQDGRLMCLFYNGYAHGSPNNAQFPNAGRIDYSISTDSGYSWSTPQVLYDGPADDHDASITQLKSGQLIVSFFSDYYAGYTGVSTGYSGVMTMTSNNLGERLVRAAAGCSGSLLHQFPGPRVVQRPAHSAGILSNGFLRRQRRRLRRRVDQRQSRAKLEPARGHPVPPAGQQQWLCAETDVIQLKDSQGHWSGNLFAAQRTNFDNMYFLDLCRFRQHLDPVAGRSALARMCPYLHRTADDTILLAYRDYYAGTTSLRYSTNECQTWSNEVVVDTVGGAYPSITDLEDGSELITYYEEGAGSNIRVKRFSVTAGGIEFLPVVPMPEPGTICLLLTGAIGLLVYGWWKRK